MTVSSSSDSDDYDDDDFFITNSTALPSDDYPKGHFVEPVETEEKTITGGSGSVNKGKDNTIRAKSDVASGQDSSNFSSDSESFSSLEEGFQTTQVRKPSVAKTEGDVITLSSSDSESPVLENKTRPVPERRTSKKRARTSNDQPKHTNSIIVLDDSDGSLSSDTSDREWLPEGGPPATKKKNRKVITGSREAPKGVTSIINPDEDEDEDDEFYRAIREAKTTGTKSKVPHNPKRIYNIRFVSKLEGTIDKCVKVRVLGKFTFSRILPLSLEGLVKAYRIPSSIRSKYDAKNVTMYWNGAKLLDFMTCDSLKIEQAYEGEVSNVEIVLFSREDSRNMEMMYELSLIREEQGVNTDSGKHLSLKDVASAAVIANGSTTQDSSDLIIEEFEKELEDVKNASHGIVASNGNSNVEQPLLTEGINKEGQDVLTISLVGEDNKKLLVRVHEWTKLSKVVEYYRTQKSIPKKAKITLYFDNEPLELSRSVGDYDIEDEDMLDVMVQT